MIRLKSNELVGAAGTSDITGLLCINLINNVTRKTNKVAIAVLAFHLVLVVVNHA